MESGWMCSYQTAESTAEWGLSSSTVPSSFFLLHPISLKVWRQRGQPLLTDADLFSILSDNTWTLSSPSMQLQQTLIKQFPANDSFLQPTHPYIAQQPKPRQLAADMQSNYEFTDFVSQGQVEVQCLALGNLVQLRGFLAVMTLSCHVGRRWRTRNAQKGYSDFGVFTHYCNMVFTQDEWKLS